MKAKDLLTLKDLSKEEILEIIDLSEQLKYETKHGIEHHYLKGKTLGMIFRKHSTRTRVSFEVGMYQLGGFALFLNSSDIQMSRGEAIEDTGRVLARYLDGIMIRTFDQREVEELAAASRIPIINGLTDEEHPCQVLADLLTIKENKRKFKGLKVAFVGDGHNMANTLMIGCLKVDMDFSIATPKGYETKEKIIEAARLVEKDSLGTLTITNSPEEAVKDADVVITDVWTSMGQETEKNLRKEIFKSYQVNKQLMSFAKIDAMVLHCLPAHKDEEITTEIFEEHQEEIFEESENRLHVQKAVLVKLMGKNN
ncbi:ornithine carbamoyltransferase [Clostridium cellulovorans]|uniref:Ornithine carbamoyltransferase n=1 Tax=Clostridium cellulovorans (strain ATCC 35296 / DSM 3052 / OCM 3 / 743B) TaxID=573061 RepID=D9SN23_CLOC7|nr:ornithine carbamoyltransferase [Clostridium cellulovorans]ADL51889.1 ornithine carbamoyltransferase [Clostridium cellulovorans 743B]